MNNFLYSVIYMHYENDVCWSREGTDSFYNFHSHNNESLWSILNKSISILRLQQQYSLVCTPSFVFSFVFPWCWSQRRSMKILDVWQRFQPRALPGFSLVWDVWPYLTHLRSSDQQQTPERDWALSELGHRCRFPGTSAVLWEVMVELKKL